MKEVFVEGKTLPEAYHKALLALEDAPVIPCPFWNTEQKEVSMTYVVSEPMSEPMISRLFFGDPRSLEQYRQEMLDGIMDFEIERGNWVYTYHQRYASQLPFVIEELKKRYPGASYTVIHNPEGLNYHTDGKTCWVEVTVRIEDTLFYEMEGSVIG